MTSPEKELIMEPMELFGLLLEELARPAASAAQLVQVEAEVDQTDDSYILRMDLPGVELEDVHLDVIGDAINIAWTRTRRSGKDSFYGVLHCPRRGDPNSITASMKSGVLILSVAKLKGHRVEVQAG
jgi:HSP20 family molecular chaperone IbpA